VSAGGLLYQAGGVGRGVEHLTTWFHGNTASYTEKTSELPDDLFIAADKAAADARRTRRGPVEAERRLQAHSAAARVAHVQLRRSGYLRFFSQADGSVGSGSCFP
jgi:hypothetical protein